MARPTHVPKFGNFDANEEIPYTVVFDKARATKGGPGSGKPINPNDPAENPTAFGLKQDNPPAPNFNAGDDRRARTGTGAREPNATPPRAPQPSRIAERAAVPKFGDWDESDPSAGEGFTMIFTRAKDEKDAGGPSHVPAFRPTPGPTGQNNGYNKPQAPKTGPEEPQPSCWARCFGRCFGW